MRLHRKRGLSGLCGVRNRASERARAMAEPAIEIVPDRLYWQSFRGYPEPQQGVHFFSTDDLLVYDPYYGDFGPLNTSQLVRFMRMLNDKMRAAEVSVPASRP
ncbi:dual specificity protein phosphatase [Pavlovales sp. CCMP2436]|nr:dual specificity protein phosphatase [Pavlovales sp. CCMP2436]